MPSGCARLPCRQRHSPCGMRCSPCNAQQNSQGTRNMENFNYHRPATVNAAAALLKKSKGGSYLAGGHTLLPTMKQGLASPSDIIDLTAIKGFSGITVTKSAVVIKAGTSHMDVVT